MSVTGKRNNDHPIINKKVLRGGSFMLKIENILYPTDFSDNSMEALRYATSLAEKFGACLHIIHVTLAAGQYMAYSSVSSYIPDSMVATERKNLESNLMKLPAKKLGTPKSVKHKVLEGIPLVEIMSYIKKNKIDMVVMGTHGHTGFKHLVMGSVAENVVRKSPVPVLTVHSKAK
jgi:nucleotide-binding universal stress UspA family protein